MKRKIQSLNILIVLLLILSMVSFSACKTEDPTPTTTATEPAKKASQDQKEFERIAADLFESYVTSDSLTLNVFLVSPGAFDIDVPEPSLGDYSADAFRTGSDFDKKQLKLLKTIDRENLKESQRLSYDILTEMLSWSAEDEKYIYYYESLSPTIGFQAELPLVLTEYHFYNKEDFDYYLELIALVPDYFEQIITFEEEKKASGLFMANSAAVNTIKQIRDFTATPDDNLFLHAFENMVNAFPDLTDEEKADFIARNKTIVMEQIIPAYNNLADQLEELNKDNTRTGGLSDLRNGKGYFEYLVKHGTGSLRKIDEIEELLEAQMTESFQKMVTLSMKDPEILDKLTNLTFPETTPEAILDYLQGAIEKSYPPRTDDGYVLKTVDPSLESSISPAFFMVPPIDDDLNNTIYINKAKISDSDTLFSTLAHEGYPGHLYQITYFKSLGELPVRQLIATGGYTEGWAAYVEQRSYYLAGLDKNVADMLYHNQLYAYCLYGVADIGVNYHGWTQDDLATYLVEKNMPLEADQIKEMYESLVAEPANYIKYTLGSVEFLELRKKAENTLGTDFNEKEFHKFILDTGSAPFDLIESQMDKWMKVS